MPTLQYTYVCTHLFCSIGSESWGHQHLQDIPENLIISFILYYDSFVMYSTGLFIVTIWLCCDKQVVLWRLLRTWIKLLNVTPNLTWESFLLECSCLHILSFTWQFPMQWLKSSSKLQLEQAHWISGIYRKVPNHHWFNGPTVQYL